MAGLVHTYVNGTRVVQGNLIDFATSNLSNASWYLLDGVTPFTVSVDGTFNATVQLLGTAQAVAPLATDNAHANLATWTGANSFTINQPYTFVKAVVSNYVSGNITVALTGGGRTRGRTP